MGGVTGEARRRAADTLGVGRLDRARISLRRTRQTAFLPLIAGGTAALSAAAGALAGPAWRARQAVTCYPYGPSSCCLLLPASALGVAAAVGPWRRRVKATVMALLAAAVVAGLVAMQANGAENESVPKYGVYGKLCR